VFFHKTPRLFRMLFPSLIWKIDEEGSVLYLTFDDGPVPGVTDWVLDTLKNSGVKATFFCVGENIIQHPGLFARLIEEGHNVGNHTFNHVDGWASKKKDYIQNIEKCQELIPDSGTPLFRPPHGRINLKSRSDIQADYKVIMWDVLVGDFRKSIDTNDALDNTIKSIENGSIVLFHDSKIAEVNMKKILPEFLDRVLGQGYLFKKLVWN